MPKSINHGNSSPIKKKAFVTESQAKQIKCLPESRSEVSWGGRFITALKNKLGTFFRNKQTITPAFTLIKNRVIQRKEKVSEQRNDLLQGIACPVTTASKLNTFFTADPDGEFKDFKAGLDALLRFENQPDPEQQAEQDIRHPDILQNKYTEKQTLFQQTAHDVFYYFEQVVKKCYVREALQHVESALQEVQKMQVLAGQQEKLLSDLIAKTHKHIDFSYLRGKKGNKKGHETRKVQLIQRRFLKNKQDFGHYEQARTKKVAMQHSFARAEELVIRKKANAKKVATFFNDHFARIGAEKPSYQQDPFMEGVSQIASLKKRPEVGKKIFYPSKNNKKNKLLVLDMKKYYEINNDMIINFCREIIENCFERDAIGHLADVVSKMEKDGLISSELALKMNDLIHIRKIEIDIYFHNGHASEVENQWQALGWFRQHDIKKRVHRTAIQYLKDSKSESGRALSAKKNLEQGITQLIGRYIGNRDLQLVMNDNPPADQVDVALSIRKTQANKKFRWAVNMINCASNKLYLESREYRDARSFFIKNELKKQYGTQFKTKESMSSYYRAVGNSPDQIFNEGFMPALLSRMSYQKGLLNEPYVNDSAISDNKVGWTGGVVSLSDNFLHSAGGVYTMTTMQSRKARWLYLVMPAESAEVSQHLHKNSDDYAMDAREVMTTVITPDRVIAAREVKEDGSLSPVMWNPNAELSLDYSKNTDFVHYLNAEHLSHVEERNPGRRFNSKATLPPEPSEDQAATLQNSDSHKLSQPTLSVAMDNRRQDYELHLKKEKAYYERMNEESATNIDDSAKPAELELMTWQNKLAANRQDQIARYLSKTK